MFSLWYILSSQFVVQLDEIVLMFCCLKANTWKLVRNKFVTTRVRTAMERQKHEAISGWNVILEQVFLQTFDLQHAPRIELRNIFAKQHA